jgi:hypothetical protein
MYYMSTWYRIQDADRDPRALLAPANWVSTPWQPAVVTCPGCNGTGQNWDDGEMLPCEQCDGDGQGEDAPRRGVSACRSLHELAKYMDQSWGDCRGTVVIEMDGGVSGDEDFDAAAGALLVLPSEILSVTPVADVPELAEVLARDEAVR